MTTYGAVAEEQSDRIAVYGMGETAEAAIADAIVEGGILNRREDENRFVALPMSAAAAAYIGANGGAPDPAVRIAETISLDLSGRCPLSGGWPQAILDLLTLAERSTIAEVSDAR